MADTMPSKPCQVSQAEAAQRLRAYPLPVLKAVAAELQDELRRERMGLQRDQKELDDVSKRLAESKARLAAAQRRAETCEQCKRAEAEAIARVKRLLCAGRRKRAELQALNAETEQEIARLTVRVPSDDALSGNAESHIHSSALPFHQSSGGDHDVSHETTIATRAAAAVHKANDEQRRAVMQYQREQRVLQLERENDLMRRHLEVLRRGDASSTSLYRVLAGERAI